MNDYLLSDLERPGWLIYPQELIDLVAAGRTDLAPWHISKVDAVRWCLARFRRRLGRELVAFAQRQDREDWACFEKSKEGQVLIIHDNSDPGWEDEGCHASFGDWLCDVEDENREWQRSAVSCSVEHAIAAIVSGAFDDRALNSLADVAASRETSRQFVDRLIAERSSSGDSPEEAVSKAMHFLEGLADHSKSTAVALMKHLHPYADQLKMHDVHDAINLWSSASQDR